MTFVKNFESEIKSLLDQTQRPEIVAMKFLNYFENSENIWNKEDLENFCRYLLRAGFYVTLVEFLARMIERNKPIPWAYFIEGIGRSKMILTNEQKEMLIAFLIESQGLEEASLSKALDSQIPEFNTYRLQFLNKEQDRITSIRLKDVEQLEFYKNQELLEKEKEHLQKLLRKYPHDDQISALHREFKERHAFKIFEKKKDKKNNLRNPFCLEEETDNIGLNIFNSIKRTTKTNPNDIRDYVVALISMEKNEEALELIEKNLLDLESLWLYGELLALNQKFIELLNLLEVIEKNYAQNSETFPGTAYLRAQAYWGLGQKNKAIDILQSLVQTYPQHRSAEVLLETWRHD